MTPGLDPEEAGDEGSTAVRVMAVSAVVVAVLLVAVLLLSGGSGHTYTLQFESAGQLVNGNQVQISGRPAGIVESIDLDAENRARVRVSLDAPLREGSEAIVRSTSLSGVANRYVSIQPGPPGAPELSDGAVIEEAATTSAVDLDQLFNALDPDTQRGLQRLIQGQGTVYSDRGEDANETWRYLNPAVAVTSRLVAEAGRDEQALRSFLLEGSSAIAALANRREELSSFTETAHAALGAVASEDRALDRSLQALPGTLRQGSTTLLNLRATLDDLDPLVATSLPATRNLAPFLRDLRRITGPARPVLGDLAASLDRPGRSDDLVDLMQMMPQLRRGAQRASRSSSRALADFLPQLQFMRPYSPELVLALQKLGAITANYDANGHYARIMPMSANFRHNPETGRLEPQSASQRLSELDPVFNRRCPGAASQPRPDGSNPFRDLDGDLDCDPSQVLEGP